MRFGIFSIVLALALGGGSPRILGNISVNGIDIGGLGRAAAYERLCAELNMDGLQIKILAADAVHIYTFADFAAGYDIDAALDEVMDFSDAGIFAGIQRRVSLNFTPRDFAAEYKYDAALVEEIAAEIAAAHNIAPREPSYTITAGRFDIKEGRQGRQMDITALARDIGGALNNKKSAEISAVFDAVATRMTAADFAEATDLIGTFATPFDPANPSRATNIRVASNFLDNQTILPQEVFSTSAALRPRVTENGYVNAGQIVNGRPDEGVGGGICQVSSTLYMAALYAELPIVERRSHSLQVGYMAPATDATLAEGHIDLKIKNDRNRPVLIQSVLTENRHIINIYGRETRPAGRRISFESILTEHAAHPEGEQPFAGMEGGKYELYKIIENSGGAERVKINTSAYKPLLDVRE